MTGDYRSSSHRTADATPTVKLSAPASNNKSYQVTHGERLLIRASLAVQTLFMRNLPLALTPTTCETAHTLATVSIQVFGRFDQMKRLAYVSLTG